MEYSARRLYWNGVLMSTCFAFAEGTITAIMAISKALIDPELYQRSGLVLYACFALGTFPAPALAHLFGMKWSLVVGLIGFALFAAGYIYPRDYTILPTAAVSGLLGALLWTAQGAYFTTNALHYAEARQEEGTADDEEEEKKAIGIMSGMFAGIFPLALALCKMLSSVILTAKLPHAIPVIYSVYTGTGVLCVIGMALVLPFKGSFAIGGVGRSCWTHAVSTLEALCDLRMLLMVPTNVAFGLMAGFFPLVMTDVVHKSHGKEAIGWLFAVTGLSAALLAYPYAMLSNSFRFGRPLVMAIGALSYLAVCCTVRWAPKETLESWKVLVMMFVLYGSGSTVWQGTCMAIFADYWGSNPSPAFANLKLHSGATTAVAYATFKYATTEELTLLCLAVVVVGYILYLVTFVVWGQELVDDTAPDDTAGRIFMSTLAVQGRYSLPSPSHRSSSTYQRVPPWNR